MKLIYDQFYTIPLEYMYKIIYLIIPYTLIQFAYCNLSIEYLFPLTDEAVDFLKNKTSYPEIEKTKIINFFNKIDTFTLSIEPGKVSLGYVTAFFCSACKSRFIPDFLDQILKNLNSSYVEIVIFVIDPLSNQFTKTCQNYKNIFNEYNFLLKGRRIVPDLQLNISCHHTGNYLFPFLQRYFSLPVVSIPAKIHIQQRLLQIL